MLAVSVNQMKCVLALIAHKASVNAASDVCVHSPTSLCFFEQQGNTACMVWWKWQRQDLHEGSLICDQAQAYAIVATEQNNLDRGRMAGYDEAAKSDSDTLFDGSFGRNTRKNAWREQKRSYSGSR